MSLLAGHRTPYDLARLRALDWERLIPTQEMNWEGQYMQVVRLPGAEPAWLVMQPESWSQIKRFVEWVQQCDASNLPEKPPLLIPLSSDEQRLWSSYLKKRGRL